MPSPSRSIGTSTISGPEPRRGGEQHCSPASMAKRPARHQPRRDSGQQLRDADGGDQRLWIATRRTPVSSAESRANGEVERNPEEDAAARVMDEEHVRPPVSACSGARRADEGLAAAPATRASQRKRPNHEAARADEPSRGRCEPGRRALIRLEKAHSRPEDAKTNSPTDGGQPRARGRCRTPFGDRVSDTGDPTGGSRHPATCRRKTRATRRRVRVRRSAAQGVRIAAAARSARRRGARSGATVAPRGHDGGQDQRPATPSRNDSRWQGGSFGARGRRDRRVDHAASENADGGRSASRPGSRDHQPQLRACRAVISAGSRHGVRRLGPVASAELYRAVQRHIGWPVASVSSTSVVPWVRALTQARSRSAPTSRDPRSRTPADQGGLPQAPTEPVPRGQERGAGSAGGLPSAPQVGLRVPPARGERVEDRDPEPDGEQAPEG